MKFFISTLPPFLSTSLHSSSTSIHPHTPQSFLIHLHYRHPHILIRFLVLSVVEDLCTSILGHSHSSSCADLRFEISSIVEYTNQLLYMYIHPWSFALLLVTVLYYHGRRILLQCMQSSFVLQGRICTVVECAYLLPCTQSCLELSRFCC